MITEVPTERPVSVPEVPMAATAVLLLVQVPPVVASLRTEEGEPLKQSVVLPVIGVNPGIAFMVTTFVAEPEHVPKLEV